MKKTCKTFSLILICFGLLAQFSANAQFVALKTDGAAAATETNKSIGDQASKVAKEIKKNAEELQNKIVGAIEAGQEYAASVSETATAVQQNINDVRNTAISAIEAGQSVYSDVSDTVGSVSGAVGNVSGAVGAAEGAVSQAAGSGAISALGLGGQIDEINKQMTDRLTVVGDDLRSKKAAADENVNSYQSMYDSATDPEQQAQLNELLTAALAEQEQYASALDEFENNQETYMAADEEYSQLAEQLAQLQEQKAGLISSGTELLSGYFNRMLEMSDGERKEQYQEALKNNFLGKDETETPEANERIMKYRRNESVREQAKVLSLAITQKQNQEADEEKIERSQQNMAAVDHSQTSVNMAIEQRIKDVDILYQYTQLLLADLKYKTARNMLIMPAKLRDYDRDPSVLNFDDYVFTKDSVKSDSQSVNPFDQILGK